MTPVVSADALRLVRPAPPPTRSALLSVPVVRYDAFAMVGGSSAALMTPVVSADALRLVRPAPLPARNVATSVPLTSSALLVAGLPTPTLLAKCAVPPKNVFPLTFNMYERVVPMATLPLIDGVNGTRSKNAVVPDAATSSGTFEGVNALVVYSAAPVTIRRLVTYALVGTVLFWPIVKGSPPLVGVPDTAVGPATSVPLMNSRMFVEVSDVMAMCVHVFSATVMAEFTYINEPL